MGTDFFVTQRKKLAIAAAFVVGVMLMVGSEDDPGMIQEIAGPSAQSGPAPAPAPAGDEPGPPASVGVDQAALESWYSQAGAEAAPTETEPLDPAPEDGARPVGGTLPPLATEPLD